MKLKILISVIMIMLLSLTMMNDSVFATEAGPEPSPTPEASTGMDNAASAPYGVEVALYLMESSEEWSYGDMDAKEWSEPSSESIVIAEDGTYTFTITDLEIPADNLMLCYLKDVAAYPKGSKVTKSNLPEDTMIITNVFKVNGSEMKVNDLVRTGLKKGLFDIAYRNNWDDNDNCVTFSKPINSIEITITVTGITGEPGALEYVPPVEEATPTAAPTTNPVNSDTTTTTAAPTDAEGFDYTLPIVIGGVALLMIIAVVVFVIRKKKI